MFAYFSIYSVFALVAVTSRKHSERTLLIPIMLFLLLFMGSRYWVGCDFLGYISRFRNSSDIFNIDFLIAQYEPGFQILITSIRSMGLEYIWFNMAASAIMLLAYYKFLRNQYKPLIVLAILFPIVIVQLSMSGVRQGIAVALFCVAMTYFVKKKRLLTGFWILLGTSFHSSLIVFFPLAFIPGKSISVFKLIVGIVLGIGIAVFFLPDRFDAYQDRYFTHVSGQIASSGALIRYSLTLVSVVLFFKYRKHVEAHFPDHYQLFLVFSLITTALGLLAFINTVLLHRLLYYVMPVSLAMLVCASTFAFSVSQRHTAYGVVLGAYGFYMLVWFMTARHALECYVPYQSYFLL